MNMIVSFMLSFLDEENSFWVFTFLIENILGEVYFEKVSHGRSLFGFLTERYIIM